MIQKQLNLMKILKFIFKSYYQHVFAAVYSNAFQILDIFFEKGLDFSKTIKTRSYMYQLVKQAIKSRSIDCLIIFIQKGLPTHGSLNSTPLINAVKNCLTDAILPLIENGADPYHKTSDGETALSLACHTQNVEAVQILVDNMIDIDLNPTDKFILFFLFF